MSIPRANDMVEKMMISIDDGSIAPKLVESALDLPCSLAQSFAMNPSHVLPSVSSATSSKPLMHQHSDIPKAENSRLEPMLRELKKCGTSNVAHMLTRGWRMVLPASKQLSSALTLHSSFYQQGGHLWV